MSHKIILETFPDQSCKIHLKVGKGIVPLCSFYIEFLNPNILSVDMGPFYQLPDRIGRYKLPIVFGTTRMQIVHQILSDIVGICDYELSNKEA